MTYNMNDKKAAFLQMNNMNVMSCLVKPFDSTGFFMTVLIV